MPIYLFWGEDDFAMQRAVQGLRDRTLNSDWATFNYDKIPPEQADGIVQALNQAMTPPFGMGDRLVWLVNTSLCQRCPEDLLVELERTLPNLPEETVLLLTTPNKPDGRLKSTKLLQKHAEIQEFSPISPWKTDQIVQQVRQAAQEISVELTFDAVNLLAASIGNNTRQLYTELEKLRLYQGAYKQALDEAAITPLITSTTQSSLQLAAAIRQGDTGKALALVTDLFAHNEAALRIVATLVGQFRTWLWVKLMLEAGEHDEKVIAQAAEIGNPKRVYFLQQEVRAMPLDSLRRSLPLLLELEFGLKQGVSEIPLMQTKVIELCHLYE